MKGTGLNAQLSLRDFAMSLDTPGLARLNDKSGVSAQRNFHDVAPKTGMRGAVAPRTGDVLWLHCGRRSILTSTLLGGSDPSQPTRERFAS